MRVFLRLLKHLKSYWRWVVMSIVCLLFLTILNLLPPLFQKQIIDEVVGKRLLGHLLMLMMIAAAKAAYAHEFIVNMPQGYDTELGERGVKLSGGQKQRLALARAILTNPLILILDEATSSVDAEAEYLIQQALEKVLEGRTALVIAHRLSTIRHADKIIALEDGRIVEVGDHRELLARGGLYSQMYRRQYDLMAASDSPTR
jgi:ATP-binding cassette subfamily B protein